MIRPFTRHCDECQNWRYTDDIDDKPICAKGHTPRFYMPRFYGDDGCGFKRRCADYKAISELNSKEKAKYSLGGGCEVINLPKVRRA